MNKKKWYACELHCHTIHSDGQFTVSDLLSTAKGRHLDGICLTDHNTVSGHAETEKADIAVVKGIEWTTYFGHMPVLDCDRYVDWRDAVPGNIDEKMTEVHEGNGLVGIAHPFQLGTPICTGGHWDYNVKDWSLVNYMEIWSEGCPFMNSPNERARALWHSLLDKGYRITPTFGRDWHRKENNVYHSACTYLLCDEGKLTDKKMKTAIAEGRTVISMGPLFYFTAEDGKTVGDEISEGKHKLSFILDFSRMELMGVPEKVKPRVIRITGEKGSILSEIPYNKKSAELDFQNSKWYTAELWGSIDEKENCLIAMTAPIYIK